jgi:hypothetical protein
MLGDRGGQIPSLGSLVDIDSRVENLITGLVFGLNLFEGLRGIVKHSQLTISVRSKHLLLPSASRAKKSIG